MDEKVYTLEEIEGFCLGQLPAAERQAFEQQLAVSSQLQQQVRLLQSIFDGFAAWQTEVFVDNMKAWSQEQEATDSAELIEWYLNGELGTVAKQYVEEKRRTDPAFEALLMNQRELLNGFEAIRTSSFAEQMNQWEGQTTEKTNIRKLNPWIKRLSIAASILVLVGFGGWAYMKGQYSNEKLFVSLYQSPNIGGTLGSQSLDAFQEQFTLAHRTLSAQQFTEAITQFTALQASINELELDPLAKTFYEDNVEWSLLLARLGNDQVSPAFLTQLQAMAADPQHEYQRPAQDLLTKLNSIWR